MYYFDGHCDTVSRCMQAGEGMAQNTGHIDFARGNALGAYAQIFALFYDSPTGGCFPQAEAQHAFLLRELERNRDRAVLCRTAAEVRSAVEQSKTAALLGIEGGELLNCDPALVETAADWGAQYVTLTWNHRNAISGTNCDAPEQGLTDRGRAFVRELYRCAIVPDVSHLSDAGFWDLVRMERGPVIASHSNSRALCAHRRNLTDDMFRAVADTGGVVGLNLYAEFVGENDGDVEALLRHADRFLSLGGEDALCFGGDMDGCETLTAGIAGLESVPDLCDAFRRHGYDEPLLEKLFYRNWLSFLERRG